MQVIVPVDHILRRQSISQGASPDSQALVKRFERSQSLLAKQRSGLSRISDSSHLEIARESDLDSIFKIFTSACTKGTEKGGFLRATYSKDEISTFITEGYGRVVRDESGAVAAFGVVVPGDHNKFALERFAVGFKLCGFFIRTCTWLDGDFKPLDWPNIRYFALFAQSPKHVISEELFRNLLQDLKKETSPQKDIYMTVSAEPKPNQYIASLVHQLRFKKVGYFRSKWGRPMAYVDGMKWLRPWRSDIYRLEDNQS